MYALNKIIFFFKKNLIDIAVQIIDINLSKIIKKAEIIKICKFYKKRWNKEKKYE